MGIGVICGATAVSALASYGIRFLQASNFVVLAVSAIVFFGVYVLVLHFCKDPFVMLGEEKLLAILKSRRVHGNP